MKRIPRNSEKFGTIDLFDAIGSKQGFKLGDADSEKAFLESISKSFREKTPIILHGRRVEAMFAYVAASLGRCAAIKQEDSGEIFTSDPAVRVPDYRLVLRDGKQLLVEVKNCHKIDPCYRYSIKASYIGDLKLYADLFQIELRLALYWSRWNQWVLISPEDMELDGAKYFITFVDACKRNQMSSLGDKMVGTTPPLGFRLLTDSTKPRQIDKTGHVAFTIGGVELCCAGRVILEKAERNIAFYLILYGNWPASEPVAQIENDELIAMDYIARPVEETPGQGFEIVGSLSGMISRHYNNLTAPTGHIDRLTPAVDPATLGISLPDNYKGRHLPLWRLVLQPAD